MRPLAMREIAEAVGAAYTGADLTVSDICTDTRRLEPGCLFVALSGDNFDGHDYILQALENGAALAISHKPAEHPRVLQVRDTRRALLDIAGLYRRTLNPKVVAVTGSVGKTTTKELTALVLGSAFKTLKTPANLNNEVGLAQTALMLEDHAAAVFELGVDGPGQMEPLSLCAAPDVGLVTNIGVSHLAQFKTRQGIMAEKLRIRAGMPDGAVLALNGDDDLLSGVCDERLRILRYGLENPENDVKATSLRHHQTGSTFRILWRGEEYPAQLPLMGRHNILGALAAFTAGVSLGIDPEKAARALAGYQPEGMRQNTVKHNGFTVVEDCYNASPDSMRAALSTLGETPCEGRRIAVLSDMLELGETEREEHRQIGRYAASCGLDILLCAGELAAEYVSGAAEKGLDARHYPNQDALLAGLKELARPGDVLWFKGSRGMRLENVLRKFYKEF